MCSVEIFDFPCLASGNNSNLASEDMADLQRQVISVEDNNDPSPKQIPVSEKLSLTTNGIEEKLDIRSNNFPEVIKKFTQHIC